MEREYMKKRIRASFTIEAAFIVPLILIGIVALIWLVFYLFNSVKLLADLDRAVFTAEKEYADGEIGNGEKKYLDRSLGTYYGATVKNAYVERDGKNITADIEAVMNLPKDGILGSMVSGIRDINGTVKSKIPAKTEITRIIKAASGLLSEIVSDVKSSSDKGK